MDRLLLRVLVFARELSSEEDGQDLIEYALIVALLTFGAVTGMRFLSTGLNRAFSQVAAMLTSNLT